jgi:very-short-patch-repair endonuclease
MDVQRFIDERGSLAATWELHTLGMNRRSIADAVSGGVIVRVRQGWYCNPWLEVAAQRAARVGGQLTCISAARHYGLWIPEGDHGLHVSVEPNACQLREPSSYRRRLADPSAVVHWAGRDDSISRVVVPPLPALIRSALCCTPEIAFVLVESALNRRLITEAQWESAASLLPEAVLARIPPVTRLSDSGVESMFVARMRSLGIPVRQQVAISGVGVVDALIGERLVVEVDGVRFHRDDARDRRRDAVSSVNGYRVLRFLANQVTREWQLVEDAVLAAMNRGDHLSA